MTYANKTINIFFICLLIRLIAFYQKFAKKYPHRIAIELTGVKTKHEKILSNILLNLYILN
jgi:hypothetical protein